MTIPRLENSQPPGSRNSGEEEKVEINKTSPFDLSGRRILVTGAAGGIGGATARLCAQMGAEITLVDIADVASVRGRVGAAADKAEVYSLDTSDRAAVDSLAAKIGAVYGLVDTAAICPDGDWLDVGWDTLLERTLTVNVRGPIRLAPDLLPENGGTRRGRKSDVWIRRGMDGRDKVRPALRLHERGHAHILVQ